MIKIPFTKAHGARNDFLLTWQQEAPQHGPEAVAVAICDRNAGVGADGWLLVTPPSGGTPPAIRLFNPDGGEAEISGNGTRCAAAFLVDSGMHETELEIRTGAGQKHLRLLEQNGLKFLFEMNMGEPLVAEEHQRYALRTSAGVYDATILNVGNPQCALFVDDFDFDWKALGAEIERLPLFPNRTNVSFVKLLDEKTLDVRFFERGAGFTMSSGTGSTGAFAAARLRGLIEPEATVRTLAGPLTFRWERETIMMQGPAEIVAGGEFYFEP